MAKNSGTKSFLLGALAGGIAGSLAALVLAPKSGRELRSDISNGARKVNSHTVRIAGQVGDKTTRIAKQVGSGATRLAVRAKDSADSMIGSVRSWRSGRSDREPDAAEDGVEAEAKKEEELQTSI